MGLSGEQASMAFEGYNAYVEMQLPFMTSPTIVTQQHALEHQREKQNYPCHQCNAVFKILSLLKFHLQEHSMGVLYECQFSDFVSYGLKWN